MIKKYSVVILAAGKSSRMGKAKFLLKYDKNTTFLEKIVNEYKVFGCVNIVIVLNEQGANLIKTQVANFSTKAKIVINYHPEWERFYSIKLGLNALGEKHPTFIHNVDNPYANMLTLSLLLEHVVGYEYAIPVFNYRGGHPILLSEKVINDIINEKDHSLNLKHFLKPYKKSKVEVNDKNILLNVNSSEDYASFFSKTPF